jgi:chaperonin cofactor prefoldin
MVKNQGKEKESSAEKRIKELEDQAKHFEEKIQ